ncbi:FAD-binding oxidoreductase [Dorea sp. OM02-2LB]|nr:FAD-binding oxidoreductase [Dorea sp. OM02-2LB]
MSISREEIVEKMEQIVGKENVVTDREVLEDASHDRFRKYEGYHKVFTNPLPAAVVFVNSAEEVSSVLRYCNAKKINVVPRTGHSATEGGLETIVKDSIVLDGSHMNKILDIDEVNMQVTAECGVVLEDLENAVRKLGFTTGHSPQSKPIAQMGGLVATRSIGQFSTLYGGIEDMLAGVQTVFPDGTICDIKAVPRRSAGPDIRHIVLGNEGTTNFITKVTMKLWKYYPEYQECMGYTLDNMHDGLRVMREVMVEGYRPSVARLYDAEDGKEHFSHFAAGKCVLLFVTEGPELVSHATAEGIRKIMANHPECTQVETKLIETWFANLNWDAARIEEERKEVLETNNVCCTTEISAPWGSVDEIYDVCIKRVMEEIPDITVFGAHASHCYSNGINLYFVYWYNVVDCKPEEEITKYHLPIKKIICEETIKAGGSMCHHHGVGKHRIHWIDKEHGSALYMVKKLKQAFDPNGIMNMGTILPYKEDK